MVDYNHTSLLSSYSYEDPLNHDTRSNTSSFQPPTELYVEMKERHYEDVKEHDRELQERKLMEDQSGVTTIEERK